MDETGTGIATPSDVKYPPAGSQIPFQILTEYRTRRQGGKVFHIRIRGMEVEFSQKDAKRLADGILKVIKEK